MADREPIPIEDLEHHALRNALYHTARRQRLELWNRGLTFLVILGGAGTVSQVLVAAGFAVYLGMLITTVGALQLVFDFAGHARTHVELQRLYYSVLGQIKEGGDLSVKQRNAIMSEIVRISGEEPPTLRALDAVAYNEATDALYGEDRAHEKLHITGWQSATRHLQPHNGASFPRAVAKKNAENAEKTK